MLQDEVDVVAQSDDGASLNTRVPPLALTDDQRKRIMRLQVMEQQPHRCDLFNPCPGRSCPCLRIRGITLPDELCSTAGHRQRRVPQYLLP